MNMKYDRNIADARRTARAEARDSGIPYQQTLDDLARRHGRTDWAAFVADPCPVLPSASPQEPVVASTPPEPATATVPEGPPQPSRWRSRRFLVLLAVLIAIPTTAMTSVMKSPDQLLDESRTFSEQRRRASTVHVESLGGEDPKTVYTTVRPIGRSSRVVMRTIMDFRPMKPWPGQRYVIPALAHLGVIDQNWLLSSSGMVSYEVAYHPVFRVDVVLECRTGFWRKLSSGLADDFVSPMQHWVPSDETKQRRVSEHDRSILCSDQIMHYSDDVRTLVRMPGYEDRMITMW